MTAFTSSQRIRGQPDDQPGTPPRATITALEASQSSKYTSTTPRPSQTGPTPTARARRSVRSRGAVEAAGIGAAGADVEGSPDTRGAYSSRAAHSRSGRNATSFRVAPPAFGCSWWRFVTSRPTADTHERAGEYDGFQPADASGSRVAGPRVERPRVRALRGGGDDRGARFHGSPVALPRRGRGSRNVLAGPRLRRLGLGRRAGRTRLRRRRRGDRRGRRSLGRPTHHHVLPPRLQRR